MKDKEWWKFWGKAGSVFLREWAGPLYKMTSHQRLKDRDINHDNGIGIGKWIQME